MSTAVVVIDVQYVFLQLSGKCWKTAANTNIVDAVALVLQDAHLPIRHIQDVLQARGGISRHTLAFHRDIVPEERDLVIEKLRPNAFQNISLQGITRLIVCGLSSLDCISTTVHDHRTRL